ncbi:MAG: SDR family oxidoreductase [Neisseria sp.]|nr:SDR family oxidoreductase [Neisseria sp.]
MERINTLIIGAGFGGIGMAIRLLQQDLGEVHIWEKQSAAGGTWHDNHYPGSACDIPSHLYSFSFYPKSDWSRRFAPQAEIEAYLHSCARHFGVDKLITYGREVKTATWQDEEQQWLVEDTAGRQILARYLITATGQLNIPEIPNIPGMEQFAGPILHSARWDNDYDFSGKNVAVIGTGASAIQFIPEVAQHAHHVTVYQRSAPYVIPKGDRAYSAAEKARFARYPLLLKLSRAWIWLRAEARFFGFRYLKPAMRLMRARWQRYLHSEISDPLLRQKLTPDYTPGCKRILLADNYYATMRRDNVEVHTDGIAAITRDGVVDRLGHTRAADVLLLGTGFKTTQFLFPMKISGRGGLALHEAWKDGAEAYLGTCVHGFPNFFMLYGPNINLGHNSIVYMLESQIDYICRAMSAARRHEWQALEVQAHVQAAYNRKLQEDLRKTVWSTGCSSIYVLANGKNVTNWSGFTWQFRRQTRRFLPQEFLRNGSDADVNNVLITGAASGIGRTTAQTLYRQGWTVGLVDLNHEALQELSKDWAQDRVRCYAADVSDFAALQQAIDDFAAHANGELRLLINCAGIMKIDNTENISPEFHQKTIDVNLNGTFYACLAAFPHLKKTPDAQIINLSSAATQYGVPWQSSYSASKFAIKGLTEALNLEWERYGIHVGDVLPPVIDTPMVQTQHVVSPIMERLAGGKKLSAQDVTDTIMRQIRRPRVHRPVGRKFTLLYILRDWSPEWSVRAIFRHVLMR